jgi:serine/threonine protein kinase
MQEYNVKADIWSLGCVLFEMLVGSPPFKGQNPRELFMNIRSRHIRIPPEVVISTDLKQLLLQLLEIDPRNRIDLASLLSEAERLMPTSTSDPVAPDEQSSSVDQIGKLDSLQPTGSPTSSPRHEGVIPEEQPILRPSGIAIDLSNSGGSMRRVRSRDQISGAAFMSSSPPTVGTMSSQAPAPVSTSPASQRQSSVTSATATTMLTLANSNPANPGTSPSQGNMVPKHRRSSSGEKRYSTGDMSPVTKALSLPKGEISERYPGSVADRFKQKEYPNSQVVTSRGGSGMIFGLGGPIDSSRGVSNSGSGSSNRPQQKPYDNERGEDESDDFVMVEQTPSHPWKATPPNDPAPVPSSSLMQSIPENGRWYGNSPEGQQNPVSVSSGLSQEEEMHGFNANAKRCSDTVQMVTAITAVADQMVRDALHPKKRLAGERDSKDGKTNVAADDDSVGSCSSGERSNRQRGKSFDVSQVPELLAPPFSLYLHAMTFLHDAMQRSTKFKEMTNSSSADTRNQIDALLQVNPLDLPSLRPSNRSTGSLKAIRTNLTSRRELQEVSEWE